jgi:predicted ArsR family transcriptional regulator
MTKHSNRNIPVEQWPESLEILRHLATQSAPVAVKDVAREVSAPEISTRNRLAKLEAHGTVRASRAVTSLGPGKQVTCTHYAITQYGKDCAGSRTQSQSQAFKICANSVFNWAAAMGAAQQLKT